MASTTILVDLDTMVTAPFEFGAPESGVAFDKPITLGHTDWIQVIAYSPNRHHITSGSYGYTIRIWDAETGAAVGKPLVGHPAR